MTFLPPTARGYRIVLERLFICLFVCFLGNELFATQSTVVWILPSNTFYVSLHTLLYLAPADEYLATQSTVIWIHGIFIFTLCGSRRRNPCHTKRYDIDSPQQDSACVSSDVS